MGLPHRKLPAAQQQPHLAAAATQAAIAAAADPTRSLRKSARATDATDQPTAAPQLPSAAQPEPEGSGSLDPDTPPRSPAEVESPPRRKRRRVQQTRRPDAQQQQQQPRQQQQLQQEQIQQSPPVLQSSLALDEVMPNAMCLAALAAVACSQPTTPLSAATSGFQPAVLAAAAGAATSLGTLGPPPLPLFVTPADGVTTRRRPVLTAPAATLLPPLGEAESGFASCGRGSPLAEPLLQLLPRQKGAGPTSSTSSSAKSVTCSSSTTNYDGSRGIGINRAPSGMLSSGAAHAGGAPAAAPEAQSSQQKQQQRPAALKPAVKREGSPPGGKRSRCVLTVAICDAPQHKR